MQTIDLLLRGVALGEITLICIGILASTVPKRKAASVAILGLLVSCYLIASSPNTFELFDKAKPLLIAGAIFTPVGFTWMVLEIFYDRLSGKSGWFLFASLTAIAVPLAEFSPLFSTIRSGLLVVLYLGFLYLAFSTSLDDLVEKRRVFRRWFVGVIALLGIVISVIEVGFENDSLPIIIYPIQAAAFIVVNALFYIWAFSPSPDVWPLAIVVTNRAKQITNEVNHRLIQKLETLANKGVWREEGLTIKTLANKLGVPEHKLRATINQEMGFRNFSTFINGYRIRAAKLALDDPENSGTTILEIAFDCGFSSLGPFNKAFRQHVGMSPTEYRKR